MTRLICILAAIAGLASAQEKLGKQLEKELTLALSPPVTANLELTVYLVSGLAQAQTTGKDEVPSDLASTVQQLRSAFSYKSYKLIDAITLRGRNNGGSAVGGDLPDYSHYSFSYVKARISTETPRVVHLDSLRLEITRHNLNPNRNSLALVSTDLDVKDGQKTVVGKSAVNGTDALFLVIVPKVIE